MRVVNEVVHFSKILFSYAENSRLKPRDECGAGLRKEGDCFGGISLK